MRKLAEVCIQRPIFAAMLILSMCVVGAAAYFKLGVDRLPSVDLPTVSIRTSLPGASPEETETEISQQIEEVVNTVEGVEELRSINGSGNSFVIATFNLSRDIDSAAQDVRDRVSTVIRRLPDDVEPPVVSKFDNDSAPVLTLSLSGQRTQRELTELADKIVKTQLERSAGVGEIDIDGDTERTINVWVDADKLAAYQIPITAVRDAVVRQNAEIPGGNVTGPAKEQTLRTLGRLTDPAAFNEIVITTVNGAPVRIKDVGRAEDGVREERSIARLNGEPTVALEIRRQSGANTVEVIDAVKRNLDRVRAQLPPGVNLEVIRDQSTYIRAALHEINVHLILGSILASLVVLAFMKSWRSTIIAAVAIPTSVISTFAVMWALDFTLNSVTMLALVLMVGIVIDDAIVVLENIYRFVEEKGMSPMEAAKHGTGEIALAVLATTLSLVVIFIPVSFMSSISGRFLYQFGITAAVSVMVSLLVSFTLTPMLSARMLKPSKGGGGHDAAASRKGFYGYIDRAYTAMLKFVMRFRIPTAIIAVLVMASSYPLYKSVKQDYLPSDADEAEFEMRVTAPEGASFTAVDQVMRAIEKDLLEMPQIRTVLASGGGGPLSSVNQGEVYVRIAPHEERLFSITRFIKSTLKGDPTAAFTGNYTQRDVMQQIRAKMRKYPDVRVSVRNFPSFNIGGGNFDVDFVVRGPELENLAKYTAELRTRAQQLGGFTDVDTTLKLDKPELRVNIDRERAADLGVTSQDVGTALRLMVGGDTEISRFRDPATNEDYDVQLRLSEPDRNNADEVPRLFLPGREGRLVELRNLATLEEAKTAARIDRLDRQRAANVRGGVAPGYALADRLQVLQQAANDMNLPPAYTTKVSGRGRELERTFNEFIWAFLLSIIFMYMILAANYESLIHPVTILLSLPLSIPFALLSLWLTGGSLNLYSALGILVLFGVVKKNSILQIDHMNQLRARGMDKYDAIIEGNRDRLRPILMTTLALVGGMLPLALGTGPGAEERRAVAIVVIGGQTLSLLLTLLVTPVAYSFLDKLDFRKKPTLAPATAPHAKGHEAREPVEVG
jgi:HAE1 family hydrophobic/amphiphilic exporter-1